MLVGIGHALLDLQVEAQPQVVTDLGLRLGDTVLASQEEQDTRLSMLNMSAQAMQEQPGGSIGNALVTARHLGAQVAMCCSVGDDARGQLYLNAMKEIGILCHSQIQNGKPTGTCIVAKTTENNNIERSMSTYLGASSSLEIKNKADWEHSLDAAKMLVIEGYLLSEQAIWESVLCAVSVAKLRQIPIVFTLSASGLIEGFRSRYHELIWDVGCDIVVGNEEEFQALLQLSQFCTHQDISTNNIAPLTVVTCGAQGAYAVKNRKGQSPFLLSRSAHDATVVDVLGAGDAFLGGLLYGGLVYGNLLQDDGAVQQALDLALSCGKLAVENIGPRIAATSLQEIA